MLHFSWKFFFFEENFFVFEIFAQVSGIKMLMLFSLALPSFLVQFFSLSQQLWFHLYLFWWRQRGEAMQGKMETKHFHSFSLAVCGVRIIQLFAHKLILKHFPKNYCRRRAQHSRWRRFDLSRKKRQVDFAPINIAHINFANSDFLSLFYVPQDIVAVNAYSIFGNCLKFFTYFFSWSPLPHTASFRGFLISIVNGVFLLFQIHCVKTYPFHRLMSCCKRWMVKVFI